MMTMGSRRSSEGDTSVDDLHSKASISMEFDDYPLDLVSPIARDYDDLSSPSGWRLPAEAYDLNEQKDPFLNHHREEFPNDQEEPFMNHTKQPFHIHHKEPCLNHETDPFLTHVKDQFLNDNNDPYLTGETFKFINERDRYITDEIITDLGNRRSAEYDTAVDATQQNGDIFVTAGNLHKLNSVYPVECDETPDEAHYERKGYCSAIGEWFRLSCKMCMAKYYALPDRPSWSDRWRYALLCPPHGWLSHFASLIILVLIVWGLLWTVNRPGAEAGGGLLALVILTVFSYITGSILSWIRLPALLGMFIVGCVLRNVPDINIAVNIDVHLSDVIRELGLALLLLRSGLILTPLSLRHQSFTILRLALLPSILETITAGIVSKYMLGIPWLWAFLIGFLMCTAGPVVVNPCVLSLQSRGYGLDKAIPSMLVAASSIDNIIPLTGFSVILVVLCHQARLVLNIFRGPLEAMGAVLAAMIAGMILWYIPHIQHPNHTLLRVLLLLSCACFFSLGTWALGLLRASPIGCITLVFVTVTRWRKGHMPEDEIKNVSPVSKTLAVEEVMKRLWYMVQPLFYGILGTQVNIASIDLNIVGSGIVVVLISTTIRLFATFLAVFRTSLNMKERMFIAFAWIPKAYVQLSLSLLTVQTLTNTEDMAEAEDLMRLTTTMAMLTVLITLPLGGVLTMLSGPCLLSRSTHLITVNEAEKVDLAWEDLSPRPDKMKVSDISTHTTDIEITTERETVT